MTGAVLVRTPAAALAFLTRVPVGRIVGVTREDVARATPLFPLVGGAVGGLSGVAVDALSGRLPALAAGTLGVALAALLTGALHLDALADVADGLGAATRERALEIMRDHAVGAFGVTALVLVLVTDAAVLGALGSHDRAALAGLAAGAAGRAVMLPLALVLPYARTGDGHGSVLEGMGVGRALAAVALAGLLALPAGVEGLVGVAAAAGVAIVLGVFFHRWLRGVTGDGLGATAKLAETGALVAAFAALA